MIGKPSDVYLAIATALKTLGVLTTKRGNDGTFASLRPPFVAFTAHRADAKEAGSGINGVTAITFEYQAVIFGTDEDQVVEVYAAIANVLQDEIGADWSLRELTFSASSGSDASPGASGTAMILVPLELARNTDLVRGRPTSIVVSGLDPDPLTITSATP